MFLIRDTQAGVFVGDNPSVVNLNDPFQLWIIQLSKSFRRYARATLLNKLPIVIIIAMTQILASILARIRQPRVIAEVIGGVLLGPSVMGHIPNFTNSIFPTASLPMINLTSTIGLVFFLFLVGVEIDISVVRKNYKASILISTVGLIIPLGLGAALGVPLYHQFVDPSINFGDFLLFVAVAIGITAFPVLCRILTELKLLDDMVGAVTLAAGVGNDVRIVASCLSNANAHLFTGRWLDTPCVDGSLSERVYGPDRALGPTHRYRLRSVTPLSGQMGISMASSSDCATSPAVCCVAVTGCVPGSCPTGWGATSWMSCCASALISKERPFTTRLPSIQRSHSHHPAGDTPPCQSAR